MVVTSLGAMATNYSSKPGFHNYTFTNMFQQATNMAIGWKLDVPMPLTTNAVTYFFSRPTVEGPNGQIVLLDRYSFGWYHGEFEIFEDKNYLLQSAMTDDVDWNDSKYEEWMKATNLLTLPKAQAIAEATMKSFGFPMQAQSFKKPSQTKQMTYTWKDNKTYQMPFYRFRWDGGGSDYKYEVQVSGITSNVLRCFFAQNEGVTHPTNSMHPTNYFQMLELPDHPVFVTKVMNTPDGAAVYELYTNYSK